MTHGDMMTNKSSLSSTKDAEDESLMCSYCKHVLLSDAETKRLYSYLQMTRVNINIRQML